MSERHNKTTMGRGRRETRVTRPMSLWHDQPPRCPQTHLLYVLVEEDGECHQVRTGQPADVTVHLSKHLLQVGQTMVSTVVCVCESRGIEQGND